MEFSRVSYSDFTPLWFQLVLLLSKDSRAVCGLVALTEITQPWSVFLQRIFLLKYFHLYFSTSLQSVISLKLSFHADLIVTAGGESQSWRIFSSHQARQFYPKR